MKQKSTIQVPVNLFISEFFKQLLMSILYFPAIYYSVGLKHAAITVWERLAWHERRLGVRMSAKLLLTPLYGDYSKSGRLIGFFMRLMMLIGKCFAYALIFLLGITLFLLYGIFPILIIFLLLQIN